MTETLMRPALAPQDLVPPQAVDAERSVLAAMMLDHEAIGRALELIEPPAFYRAAHQKIFEAILALYNRNEKADLITVVEELRKRGDLEAIGGVAALSQILEYAATSANLDEHARIVSSKALLRGLIQSAGEITQDCYAALDETGAILDRAEQRIFAITDRRVRQGMVPLKDLLKPAFEQIHTLYERKVHVTGVPSGYEDLDRLTSGFQPGDLVIVAGRPSMGKTALAVNFAENAAIPREPGRAAVPVAIFSLEMSKEQLVLRLLCSQSEVALHKVRNGFLGHEDWPRLTAGAGLLTQAPIMIDDAAALNVFEIRAKCRRLRAEGKLGLVVVDYLQLIRPVGRPENRVQEVSQITRGLKALAKELNVPIVALSQLSRAVEQRGSERRPQLSDLRDSGCLTAETGILRADTGAEVALGTLLESGERDIPVLSLDPDLRLVHSTMTRVFPSGIKPVFELRLASGDSVQASANHPFLTLDGWRRLDQLEVGSRIATVRPTAAIARRKHGASSEHRHVPRRERLARIAPILEDDELRRMASSDVFWDHIATIESLGEQPVFDATVPGTHNFVANGIVAHNSVEQDSDVVMFVYREEYYKPDDPALKGKATIILAKQRNGPTADVSLTFLREYTKFVPYSPLMPGETEPDF